MLQATINPRSITPHPSNPRRDVGDVTDLAASIAAVGLLEPLVVAPWPADLGPTPDPTCPTCGATGKCRTPAPDSPPSPITPAQMKALHAGLNAAGVSDRASGLAYISEEVGRTVTTSKDLTKAEASKVIDALNSLALSVPEESLPWVEE